MEWYLKVVRDNYANFNGRASRQEYWMFILFNIVFGIVCMVADNILGTVFTIGEGAYAMSMGYGWIYIIYTLAIIIPSIAVGIRRLHDVGKSGWLLLLFLIPIIGPIYMLILFCKVSDVGDNSYGPSPNG